MEKRRIFMPEFIGMKLDEAKLKEKCWSHERGVYFISYDSKYNPPSGPFRLSLYVYERRNIISRISIKIQGLFASPPDFHWYEIRQVEPDPLDQEYAKKLIEEVIG